MRWLADECIAAGLVAAMREAGHDVAYVMEVAPSLTDAQVVNLAQREERLLLTDDKDFGDLNLPANQRYSWRCLVPSRPGAAGPPMVASRACHRTVWCTALWSLHSD